MRPHIDADVIVVGAGFAGLVAAASLTESGFRVLVLEALDEPLDSLRGELIHPRGVRSLEALGLSGALRARGAVDVLGFAAYEKPTSPPVMLDYGRGNGLGLEHRTILTALRAKLQADARIRFETGARVQSLLYSAGRVAGVRCADGRVFDARLVVAADGRHSKIRRLFGIPTDVSLSSYTIGATLLGDVLPLPRHGHVFVGAPGPILAYPFGEGHVRMCIDVPLEAPHGKDGIVDYIEARYRKFVPDRIQGPMVESLRRDPLRACANHAIYTHACAVSGGALVGDAGGCSHPLTATGMTTACHDAITLTECLVRHGLTDRGLASYQQRRYGFVRARELFAYSLYEVLRGKGEGPEALRDAVFDYWQSPRARQASLDILSGDASSTGAFLGEYTRVVGSAARNLGAFAWRTKSPRASIHRTVSLVSTAYDCLDLAIDKARSALAMSTQRNLPSFDARPRTAAAIPLRQGRPEQASSSAAE
jgi:2-polyprenyl-6-methoxyphenol hydroxylase-like FAD-dependent oxidoreductase